MTISMNVLLMSLLQFDIKRVENRFPFASDRNAIEQTASDIY